MAQQCSGCGCTIKNGGVKTTEEVESGRSTGVSRTGKFNFDLTKKRYSERKYYKQATVYYCDACWKSKQRTHLFSYVAATVIVLGIVGYFYYSPSSKTEKTKESVKSSIVHENGDVLARIEVLMNQADENGEKLDSGLKEAISTDGGNTENLVFAVNQCYRIYETLKSIKSSNDYANQAADSFANAVFVRCGYFEQAKTVMVDMPKGSRQEGLDALNRDASKALQGVKTNMAEGADYYNKARTAN